MTRQDEDNRILLNLLIIILLNLLSNLMDFNYKNTFTAKLSYLPIGIINASVGNQAMTALLPLQLDSKHVQLTDEQFFQLCINNPDVNLERRKAGALIVTSPVGGDSGNREMELGTDLST
jgi:hypothetical protein